MDYGFIIGGVIALMFGGLCGLLAPSRNRMAAGWAALGTAFGPFALVALLALPAAKIEAQVELKPFGWDDL